MGRQLEQILRQVRISEIPLEVGGAVAPGTPLSEVYELLDRQRRNAVVVCEGEKVTGIFTQRDILHRTALEEYPPDTPIGELMTPQPVTLRLEDRLAHAVHTMTSHGYRNLPLVDGRGHWLGLVSSRNVLRYIAEHFPEAVLNLPPRLHQRLSSEGG